MPDVYHVNIVHVPARFAAGKSLRCAGWAKPLSLLVGKNLFLELLIQHVVALTTN